MKSKRFFAWCLTLAMLWNILALPGRAADVSLTMDNDVQVSSGDEVTLDIRIENNPGLNALSVEMYYNPEELSCVSDEDDNPNPYTAKDGTDTVLADFESEAGKQYAFNIAGMREESAGVEIGTAKFYFNVSTKKESTPEKLWDTDGIVASVRFKAVSPKTVDAKVTMHVTSANGEANAAVEFSDYTATIHINGTDPVPISSVSVTPSSVTVDGTNGGTAQAAAFDAQPQKISQGVTWSIQPAGSNGEISSDNDVTIDSSTGVITVDSKAKSGSYTVTATGDEKDASGRGEVSFTVVREEPVIEVTVGTTVSTDIRVPAKGKDPVTIPYTAVAKKGGTSVTGTEYTWSVNPQKEGGSLTGISVDDNGLVTITEDAKDAVPDTNAVAFTVTAKLKDPEVSGSDRFQVSRAASEWIMNLIQNGDSVYVEVVDQYGEYADVNYVVIDANGDHKGDSNRNPMDFTIREDYAPGEGKVIATILSPGTPTSLEKTFNNVKRYPITVARQENCTVTVKAQNDGESSHSGQDGEDITAGSPSGGENNVIARVEAGATVTLKVVCTDLYSLKTLEIRGDSGVVEYSPERTPGVQEYTFTMPAEPVTVEAVADTFHLNIDPSKPEGGTVVTIVNGVSGNQAPAGATVRVDLTPDAHYGLASLSITRNTDGEPIFYSPENVTPRGGSYAFMMPEDDVTITARFVNYQITLAPAPAGGGRLQLTQGADNQKRAAESDEVKLVVMPEEGYALADLAVTDSANNKISIRPVELSPRGGEYSFTMPRSDVTVTAQFSAIYIPIVTDPTNAKVTLTAGVVDETAAPGATVTASVMFDKGYGLGSVVVKDTAGETIESQLTPQDSQNGQFVYELSFKVPTAEEDPNVTPQNGLTICAEGENYAINVTGTQNGNVVKAVFVGAEPLENITNTAPAGAEVQLTVKAASFFALSKLVITCQDGEEIKAVEYSPEFAPNVQIYTFTMPQGDVTVTAEFANYAVTMEEANGGTVEITGGAKDGRAPEAAEVTLKVTPNDDYALKTLTVTTVEEENPVSISFTPEVKPEGGEYKFTMPRGDVTVSAEFVQDTFEVSFENAGNGNISVNGESQSPVKAKAGSTVTVEASPNENYGLLSLMVTDAQNNEVAKPSVSSTGGTYTFIMPADNVTVEAEFGNFPIMVEIKKDANGQTHGEINVKVDGTIQNADIFAPEGAAITLTASTTESGYTHNVKVIKNSGEGNNNEKVETTKSGDVYTFTMPKEGVTVEAEFTPPTVFRISDATEKPIHLKATVGQTGGDEIKEAALGSIIKLQLIYGKYAGKNGDIPYEAADFTVSSVTLTDGSGKPLTDGDGNPVTATADGSGVYSFTMPQSDVKVKANYTQVRFPMEIQKGEEGETGSIQVNGKSLGDTTKVKQGDTVTIKWIGDYQKWVGIIPPNIADLNLSPSAESQTATFTMPGRAVAVKPDGTGPCYVATAVYGSYDCPEVWTLRRFRDRVLAKTWYGRLFIRLYYAVSPTVVRICGKTDWFQNFWRGRLDQMVSNLQAQGFASTPYTDRSWK